MSLFNFYDNEVTLEELQLLIVNKTSGKITIDYKLTLELDGDTQKKEFLADVVSFANTNGGLLIYGMQEEAGIPVKLVGISSADFDIFKGQIESIIRDGIAPKLNGVIVVDVQVTEEQKVIVIKVPQSWFSPHLVSFNKLSISFARNSSSGKYQLEIFEIRSSILSLENLYDKFKYFMQERTSRITHNNTPVPLIDNPKFVLHLIPINSFLNQEKIDCQKIDLVMYKPNLLSNYFKNFNYDGTVFHNQNGASNQANQYIQVFRNGIIETVNSDFVKNQVNEKIIFSSKFEQFYIKMVPMLISFLNNFGYYYPFILFLSVLGIKGYSLSNPNTYDLIIDSKPIKEDTLLMEDILIEFNSKNDIEKSLKFVFDPIWNACNFPQSMNYDSAGKRIKNIQ